MPKGVYVHKKGYKRSPVSVQTRIKMSLSHKGSVPWNKGIFGVIKATESRKEKMRKIAKNKGFGKWMSKYTGEEANRWSGDKVSYRGLHLWIRKLKGPPKICDCCGVKKTTPKSIQWANIGHTYKRDLDDWVSLCPSCHIKFDGR